jgi:UDP-2,4-diacetamido-2,4,6-trideoxy-beta-L-altropyranose hydrolase
MNLADIPAQGHRRLQDGPASRGVVFRTDASFDIGTGHLMRCLTLADELRRKGARCLFVCRPHAGHLLERVAERGHGTIALPPLDEGDGNGIPAGTAHERWLGTGWRRDAEDVRRALAGQGVDWLVVDHYALDRHWERELRPLGARIMVIDDLADRPHDCDLLLDQNLGRTASDYAGLLPAHATTLAGPRYALLRPEFAGLREGSLARRADGRLQRLLVAMGGVDKENVSEQVLDVLEGTMPESDLRTTVVLGPHAPWLESVRARAARMHRSTQVLVGVSDMASVMAENDFAIGAAGGTAWERCCMGLPSAVQVLAENQRAGAAALQAAGAAFLLDRLGDLPGLLEQISSPGGAALLRRTSAAASEVTDGQGASRVVHHLGVFHD